jgi:hypothetical protein
VGHAKGLTVLFASQPWCGGYHWGLTTGGTSVSYAVVADCASPPSDAEFAPLDLTASHEVAEAATNPCKGNGCTGYSLDTGHFVWQFVPALLTERGFDALIPVGGEVADLCESNADGFTPQGTLVDVQRLWSNEAMLAGHDPCVPTNGSAAYFNARALLPDDIDFVVDANTTIRTGGVAVPIGSSAVVELDLYSDADTGGPWSLEAFAHDLGVSGLAALRPSLDLHFDRVTGQNGEKLHLTITRRAGAAAGTVVVVDSYLASRHNYWPIAVGQ